MKGKKLGVFALAGVLGLSLASCKKTEGDGFEVTPDYVNENASVSVSDPSSFESFVSASYEERTNILSLLEKYAVENNLTGLTLYDDGGYSKYNSRVQIPTKVVGTQGGTNLHDYVVGYGFGVIEEGKLNGELSGVSTYKTYYHTFEPSDPASLNYMNDKGSVVGTYNPWVASSYFSTRLNESKDGYEWFGSLATDANKVEGQYRPIPVVDGNEKTDNLQQMSTKYRIYVDTTAKYDTLSTKFASFNGRQIALEDYLTPFKELFNQSNGLARGAENLTGAASIKGTKEYYDATSKGYSQEAWDNVGIKTGTNSTGSYLEFEFNTPCTPFYAMYYLSSSLYTPIPADFLTAIGGIKNWGTFNEDKTMSPVDTTLSTGPFVVEAWQSDKEFVFKRNDLCSASVKGGEDRYTIDGVHVNILKAATSDTLAAWKEYTDGKLDAVAIPKDKLATEKNTANTQITKGSSTTKLNLNTCTPEEWEYLFGENGTITQTRKSDYYEVKPIMSNDNFLKGLSYAIDRKTYAENHGVTPSVEYFSDAYLSDPENGVSYNDTDQHDAVMKEMYGANYETTYGYDFDKATQYFKQAADELIAQGKYKKGDKIELTIWWQAENQIQNNGAELKEFIESAWNAANTGLTLTINNDAVTLWSDVYYKKMMVGQFDIAFGGISGNTLNPLNFMEVLKSDNSSGFTLNWGPNTNDPNYETITYNGQKYTFDALFQVADTGAAINADGSLATLYDAELYSNVLNEDGTRTVKVKYANVNKEGIASSELVSVVVCWYESDVEGGYEEFALDASAYSYDASTQMLTVTVPKEIVDKYKGQISIDIITAITQGSGSQAVSTTKISSLTSEFWTYVG